jgi:hypothetical protein
LLVLADLRQRGFTIGQLHAIVNVLKAQFQTGLFAATGGGGPVQLLTDGHEVYARTVGGEFYSLLKDPGQPMLVIGNEGLLKELITSLRPRRASRRAKAAGRRSKVKREGSN